MKKKNSLSRRFLVGIITMMLVFSAVPYLPMQGNVPVAEAAKVKLNTKKVVLKRGDRKNLKLKNASGKITWKSSKKSVASVNKKGVVKAKKAGTAIITATYKKKEYTCRITVKSSGSGSAGTGVSGGTVYWVPGGSVYHVSRSCPTLSNSKNVYSGSVSGSGKSRACKVCS